MQTDDDALFAELKERTSGASETQLVAYADGLGGVDQLLDRVFANLPGAFQPERAVGVDADIQYEITTAERTFERFVRIHQGSCRTGQGRLDRPTTTMTVGLADFLRVLTGTLHPIKAFLGRKVRVSGDMMTATKFESWFARPGSDSGR